MRDLRSRLREIVRQELPRPAAAPVAPGDQDAAAARSADSDAGAVVEETAARLGGTVHGDAGVSACVHVDRVRDADDRHGARRLGDCGLDGQVPLSLFDPRLDGRADLLARAVFFDIETTGLSGGAGTVAFLAGCAWFEPPGLRIRQFLIAGPAGEQAMLADLAALLEPATLVVTYNGRSFDVPAMETRCAYHRRGSPFEAKPHLDMLPVARRLWGRRGLRPSAAIGRAAYGLNTDSACRLSTLERTVLGFVRQRDVPGDEIPIRYFQFLRTREAVLLEDVLDHNRHDLVSLALLMSHALRLASEGPEGCRSGGEQLGLGRLYERAGDLGRAIRFYELAGAGRDPDVRAQALARLAVLFGRARRHAEAARAWRGILSPLGEAGRPSTTLERRAAEALAIHHEHRDRDFGEARRYAEALRKGASGRLETEASRRLERLERKMRTNGQMPFVER